MYGDFRVDRMYGYGSGDRMYGGNEAGWGDKMLGGNGYDRMGGNRDKDALYTRFGDDQVNAQDGQRNVITRGSGNDPIYIDSKLDVPRDCGTGRASSPGSRRPLHPHRRGPRGPRRRRACLPEKKLKEHLEHGDEILTPSGCSDATQGR